MKTQVKSALFALYKYSGITHVQEMIGRLAGRSFMSILLFHRVTDEIPEDGITVGTERFRRTCRMLRRQFNVVSLSELFRLARSGEKFPRRTLAITFDDSYRDNLFAARVLGEFGLPACFFIPTGYVGTDRQFEWDRGLKRLDNLTWDDVQEMARLGHEIGSHTVTHPDMAQVPEEQARQELRDSKETLERKLNLPVRWFAYPFGGRDNFRPERYRLVTEAGYEGCVSAFGGFVHPDAVDPILPREAVPYFKNITHLELYLRGCLRWFYALKRGAGMM